MTATRKKGFGTAPVYFTAISTILGAILFLRFGYAVGTIGMYGGLLIILLGHLITIPTALAISEISTNTRVEGGGEYFIISRSFGLNIGATIGIALYFSQAISVAFYIIAFTETFESLFSWLLNNYNIVLPRQVISLPVMALLSLLILKKGANLGVKALYFVVAILIVSLALFFLGKTDSASSGQFITENFGFHNKSDFFKVFAICFPAFTGMTAGVGLSGDLRQPGKSIPLGTILGTITGMIVYVFIVWKLSVSVSQSDLLDYQLIMARIAIGGAIVIPLGLAASTISSALGSILVAPRTLQALAADASFPSRSFNLFLAKGKGETKEPYNATLITIVLAFIFIALGNVNFVAEIISMFFMITYGSLCLISFLNHFGSSPSYRPKFKSKWYLSLTGFILSIWMMIQINAVYFIISMIVITLIYVGINYAHKDRKGLESIFKEALFQLNRRLQVYLQRIGEKSQKKSEWRPAAVCVSGNSFERDKIFQLMSWISYVHGFGTYFHFIEGYYSRSTYLEAKKTSALLINRLEAEKTNLYIDTMISPSYTTAIAQTIQAPSISGMENNMIVFEYDREHPDELNRIIDNINLTKAGDYDVCVFNASHRHIVYKNGIHVWIRPYDYENSNLMILLGYIILSHPDWHKSFIKIFHVCPKNQVEQTKRELKELVQTGRLPITLSNIEIIPIEENVNIKTVINQKSSDAALVIIGFREEQLKHNGIELFNGYNDISDILFVNSSQQKNIN